MAVVLDTALLDPRDRLEAFRSALVETSGATRVEMERSTAGVSGRMDVWSFGSTWIFTSRSTGVTMVRDAKAARGASFEAVAVAVHGIGRGFHEMGTEQRIVSTGDAMVVDVSRPFEFSWQGHGSSTSFLVPIAELDLPVDTVKRAAPRLPASPLYRLVTRHLVDLTADADELSASSTAADIGESTVHLVRALLSGAVEDDPHAPRVAEETLLVQARTYVEQNLRDPALGADSVAAALAVSRRQLYRICLRADFSLEQHIIHQRLARARAELSASGSRSLPITSVALRWGFKDPTHFSRRFKAAYGILPRDWRRLALEQAGRSGSAATG